MIGLDSTPGELAVVCTTTPQAICTGMEHENECTALHELGGAYVVAIALVLEC